MTDYLENPKERKQTFTTREIRGEFSVTARALRLYGSMGLLNPQRRGTSRIYSRRDRARLKLLLMGKRAGFSLQEIKEILDLYDLNDGGATQRKVALVKCREQISFLEQRVQEMLQAVEELKTTCQVIERIQRERGELE